MKKYIYSMIAMLFMGQFLIAQEINVNIGSAENKDYNGKTFLSDVGLAGHSSTGVTYTKPDAVGEETIFHSERYGDDLGYSVPLPNGTYTVKTYHIENYFGVDPLAPEAFVGLRIFDILLEGQLVADDFDIQVASGGDAFTHTFTGITVTDGKLDLDIAASSEKANLSAIAIIGEDNPNGFFINVGSPLDLLYGGETYIGDEGIGFNRNATFTNTSATTEPLFRSERYTHSTESGLSLSIPLPNGTYTIKTHHSELWFGKESYAPPAAAGNRIFDIIIEGQLLADDFDIFTVGNTDYTHTFANVQVTDGALSLDMPASADNANLSGIAIIPDDAGGVELYLNAAGGDVVFEGNLYRADTSSFPTVNDENTYNFIPALPELFLTERYDTSGTMELTFDVPNGNYTVLTHHSELWFGKESYAPPAVAGNRVFDISLEGQLVKDDFDIFLENSNNPVTLVFEDINVTDNVLNITMVSTADNPNIAGVSIVPQQVYEDVTLSTDRNYVLSRSFQRSMDNFDPSTVEEGDVQEQVTYVDGLGRPIQQIAVKAGPLRGDIVTHLEYDAYGRTPREFLPAPMYGAPGSFQTDTEAQRNNYYSTTYAVDTDTNAPNPFSEMLYENSPLNRPLKQAAPGKDWAMGQGNEIEFGYATNTALSVYLFEVDLSAGADSPAIATTVPPFYGAGELFKNIVKDENHQGTVSKDHTTEEFTDRLGRTVLKRTYDNEIPHDTYYVYDDHNNLTYVLPPGVTPSDGVSAQELDALGYQYRYDHRNRLVQKKVPGKQWESIVYNRLDQPIMTRDPNLAAENRWLFTKYDALGRPAYTGMVIDPRSRELVQGEVDGLTVDLWVVKQASTVIGTDTLDYSNGAYPTSGITEILSADYYDDYNFDLDGMVLPTGTVQGQALAPDTQSLPTGGKVRVLGEDHWVSTVTLYDVKGRPIYVHSKNSYLQTEDIVETELDFTGKVLRAHNTHKRTGQADIVTIDDIEYDHWSRPLKQEQQLAGHTELIFKNGYDETGLLVDKEVGNTALSPLQEVDYSYNIRGWLKNMNDTNAMGSDLFAFSIGYNEGPDALYNGNISGTQWRSQNTDTGLKGYTYTYDALNRIKTATDNTGSFNLNSIGYDKMGNITALSRQGNIVENPSLTNAAHYGPMDDLAYAYDGGNKLLSVTDNGNTDQGFKDGNTVGDDYAYDDNGNLTLDKNKGIARIEYNHLNLPTQVSINGNGNVGIIDYIYTADGTKIQKIVSDTGQGSLTATEYCGNFIYEKTGSSAQPELKFFSTPEGYVEPEYVSGAIIDWNYIYQCKDHLGNIRLSYSDDNEDGIASPSEIREENNYYPFGLKHKGYNNNQNGRDHNFEYNGMELEESLGINMMEMDLRQFDPAIGRWVVIDPITHHSMSTYNGFDNNPVYWADPSGGSVTRNGDGSVTIDGDDAAQAFINIRDSFNGDSDTGGCDDCSKCPDTCNEGKKNNSSSKIIPNANGVAGIGMGFAMLPDSQEKREVAAAAGTEVILLVVGEWAAVKVFQGGKWVYRWVKASKVARKGVNISQGAVKFSKKSADALFELGTYPSFVSIKNGVARIRIGFTKSISSRNIELIEKALKFNGATSIQVLTGPVKPEIRALFNKLIKSEKTFKGFNIERSYHPLHDFKLTKGIR